MHKLFLFSGLFAINALVAQQNQQLTNVVVFNNVNSNFNVVINQKKVAPIALIVASNQATRNSTINKINAPKKRVKQNTNNPSTSLISYTNSEKTQSNKQLKLEDTNLENNSNIANTNPTAPLIQNGNQQVLNDVLENYSNIINRNPIQLNTDNTLGNMSVNEVINQVQATQQQVQTNTSKSSSSKESNFSFDFTSSKKVSSKSSKTSHSKSHQTSRKLAKFKRNFFGKLTSHKKNKYQVDICFLWKK